MACDWNQQSQMVKGTCSGTLLALVGAIRSEDLVQTAALAATGAVVSFCVSLGLRWLQRRLRKQN